MSQCPIHYDHGTFISSCAGCDDDPRRKDGTQWPDWETCQKMLREAKVKRMEDYDFSEATRRARAEADSLEKKTVEQAAERLKEEFRKMRLERSGLCGSAAIGRFGVEGEKMNSRDRMDEAQERAARDKDVAFNKFCGDQDRQFDETLNKLFPADRMPKKAEEEKKWDNGVYDPAKYGYWAPKVSDMVQMVIENRDSPEPEVRPFLITKVLDASTGLVNGMLFMANSDIRQGEAGILGGGMSQAIRQAGFVVPEAVKGVFWLDRVHFHPKGLPRQQTTKVEKQVFEEGAPTFVLVDELQWDGKEPMLETTWRWAQ